MRTAAILGIGLGLAGCSTIIEGRNQQILVNTNPSGADCGLYRQSLRIATIQNTPGSTLIEKTKYDVWIACVKPGYQQATYYNHSGVAGATVGNIILGGGIGWIVDSATGSDNKYDSPINITLVPNMPGQPDGPIALPATFDVAVPRSNSQPQTPSAPATAPVQPTASVEGPKTN